MDVGCWINFKTILYYLPQPEFKGKKKMKKKSAVTQIISTQWTNLFQSLFPTIKPQLLSTRKNEFDKLACLLGGRADRWLSIWSE
jgi:hypothetical protein